MKGTSKITLAKEPPAAGYEIAWNGYGVKGFVDRRNQRIVFQTEGQSLKPDDIARTVLNGEQAQANRPIGDRAQLHQRARPRACPPRLLNAASPDAGASD